MTFLDAAYEILKHAGGPLHYTEIANRALATGLLDTRGQTPEATMGSRLYVDTKRPGSRFQRVSRGIFDLTEAQPSDIGQRIETLNLKTKAELRKRLRGMPADRFEALIGELLIAIGFDEATVEVTRYGGDGGIDVRGVLNAGGVTDVNAAVQAKRWKRNVQVRTVRELRGSLTAHEQGIIITTSDFSSGARKEAEEPGKTRISLINCDQLLDLFIQHSIGVTQEQHMLLSLDEEWWGELTGEDAQAPAPPPPAKPTPPAVTYPLPIQAMVHRQTIEAELLDPDGRTRYAEVEYRSPSGAGQVASGWKSCNGWTFWRYRHPDTGEWRAIDELR
jgi:restriction system protein